MKEEGRSGLSQRSKSVFKGKGNQKRKDTCGQHSSAHPHLLVALLSIRVPVSQLCKGSDVLLPGRLDGGRHTSPRRTVFTFRRSQVVSHEFTWKFCPSQKQELQREEKELAAPELLCDRQLLKLYVWFLVHLHGTSHGECSDVLVLQRRKQLLKEARSLAPGHWAYRGQNWSSSIQDQPRSRTSILLVLL